jgi:hypothetical protein
LQKKTRRICKKEAPSVMQTKVKCMARFGHHNLLHSDHKHHSQLHYLNIHAL